MSEHNYTLFVASYAGTGAAADDFTAIRSMEDDLRMCGDLRTREVS